jgi:triosephosphate isomerase
MTLSNAKPFIAGNWKMHKTVAEADELVTQLKAIAEDIREAEVVVIPPFTALSQVSRRLYGSPIQLGAQNLFWEDLGAYTGEISPLMLKEAGCRYAVVGHSERRQFFGETDDTVNRRIKAALNHRLIPIMCIGESLQEREKEETIPRVGSQLEAGLTGLSIEQFGRVIIAYEPIWAIGTGLTATPEQAQEVHAFIRAELIQNYGNEAGSYAIILYGGSVKPANTFSLLKEKDINGALVGGASLKAESFIDIVREAIKAYKEK